MKVDGKILVSLVCDLKHKILLYQDKTPKALLVATALIVRNARKQSNSHAMALQNIRQYCRSCTISILARLTHGNFGITTAISAKKLMLK
jgi:hypothetical protein